MPIRALIFDLDETLLFEEASVHEALLVTGTAIQGRYEADIAKLSQAVRFHAKELWRSFPTYEACKALGISSWEGLATEFIGESTLIHSLRKLVPAYRKDTWMRALNDQGIDDEGLAVELAELFPIIRREKHIPFPETGSVLDELKGQYILGMITNGPSEHQREKLRVAGLEHYFSKIVVSGEIGIGKPDERIFQYALNQLGLKPSEAIMIGDSLERDILGAERAGLQSVWINRHGAVCSSSQPKPCKEIANLRELQVVLKEM